MGVLSPVLRGALRGRDPYPGDLLALDFAGVGTGGRQFYKRNGVIVPRFEMLPGATSTGGNNLGQALRNGAWSGNLPDGTPLIGDGGLGVWGARTNRILWSSTFDNAAWIKSSISITPLAYGWRWQATAPFAACFQTFTVTPAETFTVTAIVKNESIDIFTIIREGVDTYRGEFNFAAGTFIAVGTGAYSGKVTGSMRLEAGGFWRLSVTVTDSPAGITSNIVRFWLGLYDAANNSPKSAVVLATGCTNGPNINDPPIFTEATAATRTAVAQSVSGLVLPSAMTAVVEVSTERAVGGAANEYVFALSDGTLNNRVSVFRQVGSNVLDARVINAGTAANPGVIVGGMGAGISRIGIAVEAGRAAFSSNGSSPTTSTPSAVPSAANILSLGLDEARTSGWLNGLIRRIYVVPRAVSNAELQALTA